ncbi:hypothetical protein ACJ41O_003358 [Fusarium nematophilum]
MIKRTSSSIFVDFPGHDSYETIMKTITRGNPDRAQGMFALVIHSFDQDNRHRGASKTMAVNVKEQFLIYAYQHLAEFVTDFQANRSGKPTNAMQAKLANWDPNLNLRQATEQQRLDWRRSYIIQWLYDLVNVPSSVVVQRNTMKGENHVYERVDWSASGPWGQHRTLFGLNEFAGEVTSMAMKKPGTDVRKMIFPHHVFQLQCIIDAFTASRGWTLNTFQGHVLEAPPRGFRPRRDVDLFLDRETKRMGRGYMQGVFILKQAYEKDHLMPGAKSRLGGFVPVLDMMQEDFRDWLGETMSMYGLNTIPPSRFSDHNPNGLWEYSPFLCAVGLMEGFELAYRSGLMLWEHIPEPLLLIHLHNMLGQTGRLARPVGLYQTVEDLFKERVFVDGKPPTSDFCPSPSRKKARSTGEIHEFLNPDANQIFRQKSNLMLYREAYWNPDGIPDVDLTFDSMLFFRRLGRVKSVDPVAKNRLEDTVLVRRAKAAGISEKDILNLVDMMSVVRGSQPVIPASAVESIIPKGYKARSAEGFNSATGGAKATGELSGINLLGPIKFDVANDVAETRPLSSSNYISATFVLIMLFTKIEDRLKEVGNASYVEAFEMPGPWRNHKRVALAMLALKEENEECLKIMGEKFDEHRTGSGVDG